MSKSHNYQAGLCTKSSLVPLAVHDRVFWFIEANQLSRPLTPSRPGTNINEIETVPLAIGTRE